MADNQPQDAFAQEIARLKTLNPGVSDHALTEAAMHSLGQQPQEQAPEGGFGSETYQGPAPFSSGGFGGSVFTPELNQQLQSMAASPTGLLVPHASVPIAGAVGRAAKSVGKALKPDVEGQIGGLLSRTFGGPASMPARIATHGEKAKALYEIADTSSTPLSRAPLADEIFKTTESLGKRNKEVVEWLQSLSSDLLGETPTYSKVHDLSQSIMNKATSLYKTNPEAASKLSNLRNTFINIMNDISPVARQAANATRLDKAEEAILPALRSTTRVKDLSTAIHTDTFLRDSLGLTSEGKVTAFLDQVERISKMEDRAKKLKAAAAVFTGVGLTGAYLYHRFLYDTLRGH